MIIKKIAKLMTRRQKILFFVLLFSMIGNSLLELLGVAIISPLIDLMQAQNQPSDFSVAVSENLFAHSVCNIFHIEPIIDNLRSIVSLMILIIVGLYIFKAGVFLLVTYFSASYSNSFSKSLSNRLYKSYLNMPYDFFTKTNSSIIIRKCTNDVTNFTNAIKGITQFLIAFFTSLAIFVYLTIVSWAISLSLTFVMVLITAISVLYIKKKAKLCGDKALKYEAKNFEILNNTIKGIKDTKVSNSEEYFIRLYKDNSFHYFKNNVKYQFISALPSIIIQTLGVIILLGILGIMIITGSEVTIIISLLSTFVIAIVKLLPCMSAITGHVVAFSFFGPSVNSLFEDLQETENQELIETEVKETQPMLFDKTITVNDLSFKYSNDDNYVLENINIEINKGDYIAFSGKSGAGKTTMVDLILGLLKPEKGFIKCDDTVIDNNNLRCWHSIISYVPQSIFLFDDTIRNNVCFGSNKNACTDEDVWNALKKADLFDYVNSLPLKLDSSIGESGIRMSGGQRQRIGLARAFLRKTPIIILDEATSALDYKTEEIILNGLAKTKGETTIIIITHRLNTISVCDKIFAIENATCKKIK